MKRFTWIADQIGRLDSIIKKHLPQYSKHAISYAIRHHHCRVNGLIERFESYKVNPKDCISIVFQDIKEQEPQYLVRYDQYTIYDKGPYVSTESFVKQTKGLIIHRLDRDTSGCLLIAHTKQAQEAFFHLFKTRQIRKHYLALVFGTPHQQQGEIITYTAPKHKRCGAVLFANTEKHMGKRTITRWSVVHSFEKYTLMLCTPVTGRTHQIRLHMRTLGHPIVGDVDYGDKKQPTHIYRPLLHAYSLKFVCPFSQEAQYIKSTNYRDLHAFIARVPNFSSFMNST